MEKCPVCNAGYTGGESCHRCKTDLGLLQAVARRAQDHMVQALDALKENDYTKMRELALKSRALKAGEKNRKLAGLFR